MKLICQKDVKVPSIDHHKHALTLITQQNQAAVSTSTKHI